MTRSHPHRIHGIDVVVKGTGLIVNKTCGSRAGRWASSLAVVDAWTSLARRFEAEDGHVQPDAVGVLDHELADVLDGMAWWRGKPMWLDSRIFRSNGRTCLCASGADDGSPHDCLFRADPRGLR